MGRRWWQSCSLPLSLAFICVMRGRSARRRRRPRRPSLRRWSSSPRIFLYSKVERASDCFLTVRASRATAYKDGSRNLLEDVSISVYGRMGERNDSLITKACDFNSSSGGIDCAGEVQMVLGPANAPPGVTRISS